MKREDAITYLHEHSTEYLKRDRTGKGFICPVCGSGSGEHGTGITENPKSRGHFTCWAGCYENADIIDILGQKNGINANDFNSKLESACEEFGIALDKTEREAEFATRPKEQPKPESCEASEEFFKRANLRLGRTSYHRGLSANTLNKFRVGYVEKWKHPKTKDNPSVPDSPRLIIPNDSGGYLARDTRENLTEAQAKFSKQRVAPSGLFNSEALKQSAEPVFIVEGEIDALSIIEAGGQATALCSINQVKNFLDFVSENPPKEPLIISLDSDERGQAAASKLDEGLLKLNIFSYRQEIPAKFKDANEFLVKDRAGFCNWVKQGREKNLVDLVKRVESEAVAHKLLDFMQQVKKNREGRAIPTGFAILDDILDGGLYPGLYCVGALSSLGKTAFLLQMADNIARAGYGVLFFSLEMSTHELIARTLSRESFLRSNQGNQGDDSIKYAKSTRGILKGFYNETEQKIISEAIEQYSEWGQRINITEGVGNVGIAEITQKIKEYMQSQEVKSILSKQDGAKSEAVKPFAVMIDYLQIIAPYDMRATDKQNTDKAVLELKRLSRDYQIPVIGISSFNRENYLAPVSMASFKESGAIEYSSDVLIGLQYTGWDYVNQEKSQDRQQRLNKIQERNNEDAKKGEAISIQVKILKNRNGRKGSLSFSFRPMFNYYNGIKEEQA